MRGEGEKCAARVLVRAAIEQFSQVVTEVRVGLEDLSLRQNKMGWPGGERFFPRDPNAACALEHLSEAKPSRGTRDRWHLSRYEHAIRE